jgi:ABC-type hemin transport system ATPase subunit
MVSAGRVTAAGSPAEVLTGEHISAMCDIWAEVTHVDGVPRIEVALAEC